MVAKHQTSLLTIAAMLTLMFAGCAIGKKDTKASFISTPILAQNEDDIARESASKVWTTSGVRSAAAWNAAGSNCRSGFS